MQIKQNTRKRMPVPLALTHCGVKWGVRRPSGLGPRVATGLRPWPYSRHVERLHSIGWRSDGMREPRYWISYQNITVQRPTSSRKTSRADVRGPLVATLVDKRCVTWKMRDKPRFDKSESLSFMRRPNNDTPVKYSRITAYILLP